MSSNVEKTREQILAERQEKKKKKAAMKNQPKVKDESKGSVSGTTPASNKDSGDGVKQPKEVQVKKSSESVHREKVSQGPDGGQVEPVKVPKPATEPKSGEVSNKPSQPDVQGTKPTGGDGEVKSEGQKTKSQLKAERRAKQEAERARKLEKAAAAAAESQEKAKKKDVQPATPTPKLAQVVKAVKTGSTAATAVSHRVKLFAHLYDGLPDTDSVDSPESVHPCILQLRTQYSSRVVSGANACCLALLNALKKVVMDFETPPNQEFSRGLENEVTKCMSYLSKHRQVAVSMTNAVKHLKFKINQCRGDEAECKNSISDWIDTYIKEQLEMAAKAICLFVREKITSGDVILTYGWSSLIHQILISAYNDGIKFRVIVADGRPWLEGRELLKKLVAAGIQCTYVFVNGLSYVMPEVTKILLGAHALLANGYVMSRVGSSQIALLAKTYNVPVLVCCETHKFSERVQTDSFVYNELGNPDDLASNKGCISKGLSQWKTIQYLTPLNLMYDVTPPDLVSAVVTEIAVLPCTSVPVILRIKPPDAF